MTIEPNQLETMVAQVASKYGLFRADLPVQECLNNSFKVINQVVINCERAGEFRYGIITKPGGTNAFGYSADNIAFKDGSNHFDVIANADAEDSNQDGIRDPQSPSFGENGPISPTRIVGPRYDMALDNSNPEPIPEPDPNPDPNPQPPSNIEKKLDEIIQQNRWIMAKLNEWENNGIPVSISAEDFPNYVGKQSGWAGGNISLKPTK